jgi:hypothetical protein
MFLWSRSRKLRQPAWEHLEKWIHASVVLHASPPTPPYVGSASIETLRVPTGNPPLNRQLRLKVSIDDENGEICAAMSAALKDRTLSGDPFLHVNLRLEKTDVENSLKEIRGAIGYCSLAVCSMSFDHDLTLPKAPAWGWKWSYE